MIIMKIVIMITLPNIILVLLIILAIVNDNTMFVLKVPGSELFDHASLAPRRVAPGRRAHIIGYDIIMT